MYVFLVVGSFDANNSELMPPRHKERATCTRLYEVNHSDNLSGGTGGRLPGTREKMMWEKALRDISRHNWLCLTLHKTY